MATLIKDEVFEAKWGEFISRISAMCVDGVKQRDDAWHKARRRTIGGSEIHKLMDMPGKDNAYMLAVQKLLGNPEEIAANEELVGVVRYALSGPTSLDAIIVRVWSVLVRHNMCSNMTCGLAKHWGSAFEDVINEYMMVTYGMRVDCENKFYNPPGPFSYSPDGITVLPAADGSAVPTLLEYKCPFTRKPTGTIPKEYLAQMYAGMDLLDLPQTLYSEAVFRICRWQDLDATTTCRLDIRDTMRIPTNAPLAYGFLGFWIPQQAGVEEVSVLANLPGDPRRCLATSLNVQEITALFSMYAAGAARIYYSPVILRGSGDGLSPRDKLDDSLEKFSSDVGGVPLGVIPWKLFSVNSKLVLRNPGFLDCWRDRAQLVIDAIEGALKFPQDYQQQYMASMLNNSLAGVDDDEPYSDEA